MQFRAAPVRHTRLTPHTCVGRDHATRPNSVMGTTSADDPPAARSGRAPEGPAVEEAPAWPGALTAGPAAWRPEALANAEAWESRGVGSSSPATMCFQVTVGDMGAISVNVTDQPASEGGEASQSLALPTFSNRRHGRLHSPATGAPSGCKLWGVGEVGC